MASFTTFNGFQSGRSYTANAVNFDGTNDYITRGADLTGNADSKLVTGSFWLYPTISHGTAGIFFRSDDTSAGFTNGFQIDILTTAVSFAAANAAGTQILSANTGGNITINAWNHVMFSFDMSDTGKRHIYLDGSDVAAYTTYTDDTIDFTRPDHSVGATDSGTNKYTGDIADMWIEYGVYTDLSVASNRRKFYSNKGDAPGLGDNGELVNGTSPILFFSGETSSWHTNKGQGGGFTETGALTDSSNLPVKT